MDVGPAGAAHPAEEAPRRWGPGEWPGEWPGTARPESPWEALVEPALTLRGGRGGHLEVGKVSGAKPLCRPRQKRDPISGTARPESPWEALVEPALTLRGGRGGHLEVGKVSGAKPLCRPRQKRDP